MSSKQFYDKYLKVEDILEIIQRQVNFENCIRDLQNFIQKYQYNGLTVGQVTELQGLLKDINENHKEWSDKIICVQRTEIGVDND